MEETAAVTSERSRPWFVLARATLAGVALGVVALASGSLILYEARGVLAAAAGLVATLAAALAAGLWAGAPGARVEGPPTWRWVGAGVALALAGAFGTLWSVLGWETNGGLVRAAALLFLVGLPVYALGFLLPGLAAWANQALPEPEEAGADGPRAGEDVVLAVLVGAAAGAALTGLFLLPALSPGVLLLGAAAVLTFPLFFPRPGSTPSGIEERLLHQEETAYGTLRVTQVVFPGGQRQPELRLYVNDEAESGELERSGAPTFAYVAAAERWLRDYTPAGSAFLFLGGGAYTLPRRMAEDDPRARITVVELDPAVSRAAYRWFGLRPEHRIVSLHGDARRVAESLPPASCDRLVVDVYGGDEMLPHHLCTLEALAVLRGLLRPGGALLLNLIGVAQGDGECRFWSTVHSVAQAFPEVRLYAHLGRDFPDRQNFLLAAGDDADRFPARAGQFEPWPREEWPQLPCVSVFRDVLPQTAAPPVTPAEERATRVPASAD